jgi:hypothetical protein
MRIIVIGHIGLLALVACGGPRTVDPPPAKHDAAIAPSADASFAAVGDAPVGIAPPDAFESDPPRGATALPMRTLAGPFEGNHRKYCWGLKSEDLDEAGHRIKCDLETPWSGKKKLEKTSAPFNEAKLFAVEGLDPHCQLGIRIGTNWFVLHEAIRCIGERAKSTLVNAVTSIEVKDYFPGGNPELLVRVTYDQSLEEYSPEEFDRTHFETLLVCGVGESDVPTCTRELPVLGRREEHATGKKPKKSKFDLELTPTAKQLTIAGDTSTLSHYLFAPLAPGTYAVTFR